MTSDVHIARSVSYFYLLLQIVKMPSWRQRREATGVTKKSVLVWAYNAVRIISPQDVLSANSIQCYSKQVR